MITIYEGFVITWNNDKTFTVSKKRFKTLRNAMDYVDAQKEIHE